MRLPGTAAGRRLTASRRSPVRNKPSPRTQPGRAPAPPAWTADTGPAAAAPPGDIAVARPSRPRPRHRAGAGRRRRRRRRQRLPLLSGRYPNLGPAASWPTPGSCSLDQIGRGLDRDPATGPGSGSTTRSCTSTVMPVAMGRAVDPDVLDNEMDAGPRAAWAPSSTRSPTTARVPPPRGGAAAARRGRAVARDAGLPAGPSWSSSTGPSPHRAPAASSRFIREQRPVADRGRPAAPRRCGARATPGRRRRWAPTATRPRAPSRRCAQPATWSSASTGASADATEQLDRIGVRAAALRDGRDHRGRRPAAADAEHATLIVGVGLHATLDDFLDGSAPGWPAPT